MAMPPEREWLPPFNKQRGAYGPEDTIRILLATDNHIGYNERDPIRGQDSINTFREILDLAVKHKVDFILLAGDLFHENKPSRDCLYKVTALLREYTLGDKPVEVELLSDPDQGKAYGFSFPAVNYEDPNFNVAIPVFSIHGNHDDPQGAGQEGALCALDILSVSGLINYMGKFDLPVTSGSNPSNPGGNPSKSKSSSTTNTQSSSSNANNKAPTDPFAEQGIHVRPVLMRKGKTRLGMYGVGNVKDQRMHVELLRNHVKMFMPKDRDDWFNLLLVHQNRAKRGPQEYVPEGLFDDSVDLVVWGHEHDCRIIPEEVAGKKYYITQPGSSVATSLADGEAIEKHIALVQIQGKKFHMTPLPLRTVRPFVIESICLQDEADSSDLDITSQIAITQFLKRKANALIDQANAQWDDRMSALEDEVANASDNTDAEEMLNRMPERMLPLVRMKVDTTGVSEMSNPIRFGQEFAGRVANPRDMLVFTRSRKSTAGARARNAAIAEGMEGVELSIDDPTLTNEEKLSKVRVGTLVEEYLRAQELQLLGERGMGDAIRVFVEKDDIHAIQTHVERSLKTLIKSVSPNEDVEIEEEEVIELLAQAKKDQDQEYAAKERERAAGRGRKEKSKAQPEPDSDADSMTMDVDMGEANGDFNSDFDNNSDEAPPPTAAKKRGAAAKATTSRTAAAAGKAAATKTAAKAKAPAKKPAAKGRGKKKVVSEDDEDEDEVIELDDDEEDEPPPPPKRGGRAAALSQPATKKAPAKRAPAASKASGSKATQSTLTFAPSQRATSSRAAAGRARGRMVVDDDEDDE
ncbi:Metallo-dependent phosphatase-like protein [Panaeolus papilionaceus]|nr:Metallo-dependent phosphatase-like protein [Panaeolus papilionaceus]